MPEITKQVLGFFNFHLLRFVLSSHVVMLWV